MEVLVRDGRQSARSTLARVHTTTWLPPEDLVVVDAIPTLGVARALFSLAALVPEIPEAQVRAAVDQALAMDIASLAVATPGSSPTPRAVAAAASAGVAPGLTRKVAPAERTWLR